MEASLTVLVCGGRTYSDRSHLSTILSLIHERKGIRLIVHGGARGADSLGGEWADQYGVPCHVYSADWGTYGKAAGLIRNRQMVDSERVDLVVAFPGGRGTGDMVRVGRCSSRA